MNAPKQEITLVKPSMTYLAAYVSALRRGWSPSEHGEVRLEELEAIERDSQAFLDSLDDREGKGKPIRLPDGTSVPRLPGLRRWLWDGDFAGSIGLRWQLGTPALPAYCLGHIGYHVVPWKRRRGYATHALRLMLPQAREQGLPYVEITTDPDNEFSQRVILANGGVLTERFLTGPAYGTSEKLRYRITLSP